MNKKDGKKKKSKLTEEEKRKQISEALKRKKECEQKALSIVTRLAEESVTKEWLLEALCFINQDYYDDIITERSIERLCGYPICSNNIEVKKQQMFHISIRDKKVYNTEERGKFCSGFCYKSSLHLKSQLDTSPLWIRDEYPKTSINLLESDKRVSNTQDKGEEIVLVEVAKLPPEDDLSDNGKQVVILENLDDESGLQICDAESGQQIYSSQQDASTKGQKSILKKKNTRTKESSEVPKSAESENATTESYPHKVRFNSEFTGLSNSVTEKLDTKNPEELFEQDLDSLSASQLIEAVNLMKQNQSQNQSEKMMPTISPPSPTESSRIEATGVNAVERSKEVLREWFTEEAAVRIVLRIPETVNVVDADDLADSDDDDEERGNQDLEDMTKKMKISNISAFHIDPELVKETERFSNKFEAFLKGKETWEEPEVKEKAEEASSSEPCLPLLDRHAQGQHRVRIVMDQIARFGAPIYELLGLPLRDIEDELRKVVPVLKLTAQNISLKPVEWRIVAIFISYILTDGYKDLLKKSCVQDKNLAILLEEFGLDIHQLNTFKQQICDHHKFNK
eukprot:TRINITY_DN3333_c0_g1_i7.p1 TRINITY_DN3333_c0_g1~~TRINITY_DN3333_c0_g1_i7.p1  ORF type:complete len:568 (-),score=134.79 TRINITY_DN3333_c0_g1_i7:99-1802(-)